MESLFAYTYLWAWEFISKEEYNSYLDKLFLETPDDEVLLELQECSSSYKKTFARLKRYFDYETNSFNTFEFGKVLFNGLEVVYKSNCYDIAEFAKRCSEIWRLLPVFLDHEQPFWQLIYADEPLSYGDEEGTRKMYEDAFEFYKK